MEDKYVCPDYSNWNQVRTSYQNSLNESFDDEATDEEAIAITVKFDEESWATFEYEFAAYQNHPNT